MTGTITQLLGLARSGDHEAVEDLWHYYAPQLHRQTARQARALRIYDEEDVVAAAFFNLIRSMSREDAKEVSGRDEFWRLLRIVVKRKLIDLVRKENAACRRGSIPIESLSEDSLVCPKGDFSNAKSEAQRDEETLIKQLKCVADKLQRPESLKIIDLKVLGLTNAEVARELDLSLRTIQYLIKEIKEVWLNAVAD